MEKLVIPNIVNKFSKELEKEIKPLGIVITKYREQSALHKRTVKELRKERDCRVCETIFKENENIANAAEYINKSKKKKKWGYKGQVDNFKLLALHPSTSIILPPLLYSAITVILFVGKVSPI